MTVSLITEICSSHKTAEINKLTNTIKTYKHKIQGGHKVEEKNSLSFPGFSRAKNLPFQKVIAIMVIWGALHAISGGSVAESQPPKIF